MIPRRALAVLALACTLFTARPANAQILNALLPPDLLQELLGVLTGKGSAGPTDTVNVIVEEPQSVVDRLVPQYGLTLVKRLFSGAVLSGTLEQIADLASDPQVRSLALDRIVLASQSVDTQATGAPLVWPKLLQYGVDGSGVGVAVVDSGISSHLDLLGKVVTSVDFQNPNGNGQDTYGHGTHVAGLIAGSGAASLSAYRGVAPGASLINLRVLDGNGMGLTSDVVNAIDWCVANQARYRIRVINLSLGHLPVEDMSVDPLVLAVNRAVAAGIVVVAAAGNYGKLPDGTPVVGGIVTPGIAPHAITVGALNTHGTAARSDDTVATFSSRGPVGSPTNRSTWRIKPDLVAPGNGLVSTEVPNTLLWQQYPQLRTYQLLGNYFKLSGTSMATPMVAGAAALLLQAKPSLTPAQVKFALQITAQLLPGAGLIEQGAGSLDIPLALAFVRAPNAASAPTQTVIAGQTVKAGGVSFMDNGDPNASSSGVNWGNAALYGDTMVWGSTIIWSDTMVWGSTIIWSDTMVWGSTIIWSDTMVWGSTIIWSDTNIQGGGGQNVPGPQGP